MKVDQTTLNDLSIFNHEDEFSVFNKLDLTMTSRGKEQLRKNLSAPFSDIAMINEIQQTLLLILKNKNKWPKIISNGTVMVVERFYDASIDQIPLGPSVISSLAYQLFHGADFSLVKYSMKHCVDFIKGMMQAVHDLLEDDAPAPWRTALTEAKKILSANELNRLRDINNVSDMSRQELLKAAHFIRYRFKANIFGLLEIFGKMDAWYGMALATEKYKLVMPVFQESSTPFVEAKGLYHIMVEDAVAYDTKLNKDHNFLFLTGANMAGKSTFIKACGVAVYLAHTGLGVPAKEMRLSCFEGLLSNINITDNVTKGESFFYNEVQRIKSTIQKISDGRNWFILIDELFKGTNVQDAMKCSKAVIEGLLKMENAVFILSTHLYEIGDELKEHPNMIFNYFETSVVNEKLSFSYTLKEGVSNDRLGYLILQQEGVVKLLQQLGNPVNK